MPGTLYIVATPIGNLEDITQRALRVLSEVDLIACEDTRHTARLLNHFGIKTRTISYHEHNEQKRAAELSQLLDSGKNIAIVSDAGTPLVSDPGFRIVSAAIERKVSVVPIPGATAFAAAVSVSGLPTGEFLFAGFLPARSNARRKKLEELRDIPATLIFYEAPHRVAKTLIDGLEVLGNRNAVVARELTKLHEEVVRGTLAELVERFSDEAKARGELVLLIDGATDRKAEAGQILGATQSAKLSERIGEFEREGLEAKDALRKAARELGLKRAEAYRLMVAQKNRRNK